MNLVNAGPNVSTAELLAHDRIPVTHPDRQPFRFNLPKAWVHFREFSKDVERTSEVFRFFECLPWRRVGETARAFLATERGREIFLKEPFLPDILDDHEALRRFGPNSLGYEYAEYMEKEGLSAAGLVAEYEAFRGDRPRLNDQVEWYLDRLRDTHDLQHMLTGFTRDPLGEQCVSAWVYKQRPSPGHLLIGYAGATMLHFKLKSRAPVLRAIWEARQIGKGCLRIFEQSILDLLPLPLDEVRARLNVRLPRYYHEVHRVWRSEGIDPYTVFVRPAAA